MGPTAFWTMPPDTAATPPVERLIRRDRTIVIVGLVSICLLSWVWVSRGAGMGMTALEMTRTGLFPHLGQPLRPMSMTSPILFGPVGDLVLMTLMWWIMMIAMMLPSATPMILLYAGTLRYAQRKGRKSAAPASASFLAGYLLVWLGFSVGAALLQMALAALGTLSSMMLWSTSKWLSAGLLAVAAVYQLTSLKRICLEHCQSPAHWLSRRFSPGVAGALRMGVEHGTFCVGCCWTLMLLLFVGGVMNVIWVAGLAIFVLLEKMSVPGFGAGYLSSAILALWAMATMFVG